MQSLHSLKKDEKISGRWAQTCRQTDRQTDRQTRDRWTQTLNIDRQIDKLLRVTGAD